MCVFGKRRVRRPCAHAWRAQMRGVFNTGTEYSKMLRDNNNEGLLKTQLTKMHELANLGDFDTAVALFETQWTGVEPEWLAKFKAVYLTGTGRNWCALGVPCRAECRAATSAATLN
ncbi:MAG TPA: hypothetical protein VEC57_19385, partial [Candidatus Limnocylindrales bacterium]|nr:hypothetical protein [Candidatus Limnocylindrales bacterium]